MGYRGDDASRAWGDPRRQEPWQPRHDDYGSDEHAGYADSGYGDQGGYGGPEGYGQSGGYQAQNGYGPQGGYGSHGGYDGQLDGYGAQPAGGFPDNDWYGGSRSGGFADTSMHVRPVIPDGYRPGDYDSPRALPAPPGPDTQNQLAQTRQQQAIDDGRRELSYPGYENVEDYGGFGSGGYPAQQGYDDYDDYANYEVPAPTTAQPAYNEPAPTTAQAAYSEPAPTTANPAYSEPGYDEPGEFGAGYDDYADGFDGQPASEGFPIPDVPATARGGRGAAGKKKGAAGKKKGKARKAGKKPRKSRRPLVLGGSAVCLIAAVAAVYVFIIKPSGEEASANAPLPPPGSSSAGQAACVKQFGQYCHIELRTDDPKPLTVAELFPPAVMSEKDHISFQRIVTQSDKTCSNAVLGQALIDAVNKGKCSQVLRASYTSGSGSHEIMGTIGVVNLATTNGAHAAGKEVGTSDFINPLASSSGVGANLGQSTGVMESQYKGHYLILTWAELANEATPTSSDNQKLMQFENDLIASTANIALSQRMVTGKPGGGN